MVIDFHTNTFKKNNEDIYGVTEKGAFVIDGASALIEKNFIENENDVSWMGKWWKKYLINNLDNTEITIREVLKRGIEAYNEEFSNFANVDDLKGYEKISASIGLTRRSYDFLEIYVLGDVEISLIDDNNKCKTITDTAIEVLDNKVINMMKEGLGKREKNIMFKGFTKKELDLLKKNRNKMNTKDGYYILAHSIEAIDNGIEVKIPIEKVNKCLLATDGIKPLNLKYSRKKLIDLIRFKGVKEIISELREIENSIIKENKIGGLKSHDDVTMVYLDFE